LSRIMRQSDADVGAAMGGAHHGYLRWPCVVRQIGYTAYGYTKGAIQRHYPEGAIQRALYIPDGQLPPLALESA
jgi:hypothetical protein